MNRKYIYIFIFGSVGTYIRYLVSLINLRGDFPYQTLLVNILGCFLIGMFMSQSFSERFSDTIRKGLTVGLCGGITTLSTFTKDFWVLMENKQNTYAILYIIVSVILSVLFVYLGDQFINNIMKVRERA